MQQIDLYALQETVLSRLQSMNDEQFGRAKLCGGTALSRCWLEHRISYDLDFFLPNGFKVMDLAVAIKQAGISFETRDLVQDDHKANQLHGDVFLEGQRLKVSFIEDAYFELYPSVSKPFGELTVQTEEIPGLYHRKLRTVARHGQGEEPDSFDGGRQKARDLFDLHVLSVKHMPLPGFIESLPYPFPTGSFINGLVSMPWLELIDELEELICAPQWAQAKDVEFLRNSLYAQIGAKTLSDDDDTGLTDEAPS
ncbi:nucleotidyl transferase AbiEii/AbiGii toxin family protein [Orrella daihaiensis]|uniref:Nucleotidyl transferase AbiEii/AbiGii toxin family protein n=1 Tax=Orrella daihaiensis TaxID=2782176 RepID=A0ABY4AMF6_9BURK|nr:nucleotidyl transferase AbiEii/AbiGii toxin family protein [Orrella daihaiensis]UOD51462.1 nucleotidyl transferase AbiEii/AbiGii toxin family protein [Orrella daihaiensis]